MRLFEAKICGEKLILQNKSGKSLFIREILVKYKVTVTTVDEKTALKTITDYIEINKEIQDKLEIQLVSTDVAEVSIIYKQDDVTLREDISL
ncbi:hypothetical protein [Acidianus sp. HS-5]|uniref:hypothetical protein n=1 Tax=Acidianus sp. HS-5 TaxID=2886040 RepID=UPI001F36651E|nr:hypothetical protein [Acidianus sp. HS-5]BDC19881.1 hypothetical protein HS5_27710 [Acidianus sp. HS-5]